MRPLSVEDLKIDFLNDHLHYQRKNHRGKQELIAKALGSSKGIRRVLDLTCGMAEDAFFLAQIGFEVRALERSRPLFEVLQQALLTARSQAPESETLARFQLQFADSINYLQSADFHEHDKSGLALYLDPMFPEKKKSALPRKEMQIFRTLVGADSDSGELFSVAMKSGVSRVVVKRPVKAEPLAPGVIHSFEGRTVRYDLYVP
jgi:16S rRNA (guanine1516-N2)-methyltransferase